MTETATAPPAETDELRIVQFNPTHEGFGMVLDYLSHRDPFADFPAKALCDAIYQQLRQGYHLVAMRRGQVVGYAGWLVTLPEIAEAWVEGRGKLLPRKGAEATAAALTIVAAEERAAVTRLIRGARVMNPGKRAYFKRGADAIKPDRKRSLRA